MLVVIIIMRHVYDGLCCRLQATVKSNNYLPNVLNVIDAEESGVDYVSPPPLYNNTHVMAIPKA